MDNASNALIIAGSVLIAVLIITVSMYALRSYRDYAESQSSLTASTQNEAFNRYFTYSAENNSKIRGYDAYNIMAKALDMNENLDTRDKIDVYLSGTKINNISALASYKTNVSWLTKEFTYNYRWGTNGKINRVSIN